MGARRLVDEQGRAYVLKLQPPGLAPWVTEALRPLGYPVPRYVVVGADHSVQEELPGRPLGNWRCPLPSRLLELNELQSARAVDAERSWPAELVRSVVAGYGDYMRLRTLEEHSDAARELLTRCRRAVESHAGALSSTGDVVHYDFTPSNVLVESGRISGVIDWGGTCSGDRLFDLATWLYYARGRDTELRRYVVDRIGEEGLSVYLAHMAIRQAEWSIRHHGNQVGRAMVAYGLELARAFP